MSADTTESTIEYFTDPPAFPADRLIARIIDDPAAARAVASELDAIQRGDVRRIELSLDPLTACLVVSFLEIGLATRPAGTDQHLVRLVIEGLEEHVGRTCPALGKVIRDARARKGDSPRA